VVAAHQIPIIAAAVYSVIRTLGPTLRYEVLGWQHAERVYASKHRIIWAFWHRIIIPIVWWHRNKGVVVMNTTAFDGSGTRKVIEWLGIRDGARGVRHAEGLRGLAVMARRLEEGVDCAFTIDGRGDEICCETGSGDAGAKNGMPHPGISHRRGPRQDFERTGTIFCCRRLFACTVILFRASDLCSQRCGCGSNGSKAQGNATRTRNVFAILAEGWFSLSEQERGKLRAQFNS